MHATLFDLAGLAIVGWVPLIFFPKWRGSRRLAESAFFPIYIGVLYAFGVGALLMERGGGFVADFGTSEGVARLLADAPIAWVAWLHILAFDQVVGIWIYRENMRRRWVSMPVQSVILFLTLMFGPIGFLAWTAIRAGKLGTGAFLGTEPADRRGVGSQADSRDARLPTLRDSAAAYRDDRGLTTTALIGVALGAIAGGRPRLVDGVQEPETLTSIVVLPRRRKNARC